MSIWARAVCGWILILACAVALPAHADEPAEAAGDAGAAARPTTAESAAERGYRLIRTKAYLPSDFPISALDAAWKIWPTELRQAAAKATPEERRQMALTRYGMIAAPGEPAGATLAYVDDGRGWWSLTCLSCHGGKVEGKAVPGLGNSHYALQTMTEEVIRSWFLMGERPSAAYASRVATPLGASNGTTNAQVFSIVLTAMRDDEMNVVEDAAVPKYADSDLDAPPLWNVKKKKRLYIDGFAEKTPRTIMQFVLFPTNDGPTIKAWESEFADILAWIESLEPPPYQGKIDRALAETGRAVFNQSCAECHGTYGADGKYPELMVPIGEVGTDAVRLNGMPREHRHRFSTGWLGEGGARKAIDEPEGYIAPPLDGIWASAPYLHNGSVPTLWHLFHSSERPAVWLRTEDGYDHARMGLEVTEMAELPATVTTGADKRRYFDTRLPGKSAAGHEFPDALSEDEKRAVMENLKTLKLG